MMESKVFDVEAAGLTFRINFIHSILYKMTSKRFLETKSNNMICQFIKNGALH